MNKDLKEDIGSGFCMCSVLSALSRNTSLGLYIYVCMCAHAKTHTHVSAYIIWSILLQVVGWMGVLPKTVTLCRLRIYLVLGQRRKLLHFIDVQLWLLKMEDVY